MLKRYQNQIKQSNNNVPLPLTQWADEMGCGEAFHMAVYHAYFAEGKNIGQVDVLTAIAADISQDSAEAREAIESGRYAAKVEED